MCGGSKTVNNTTTQQSQAANADLPEWAKPYFRAEHCTGRGGVY